MSISDTVKVSVIIPVYNRAVKTKKLLDELVRQQEKYPQTEIIVVENGSTEDMGFLNDYDTIILKHSEKGISIARNLALDIATGDYYCFVDNDDWIPSYYLETVYEHIRYGYDWYIWQWWSDDRLVDMHGLNINEPLKLQWALWGYCWKRTMFDGVRFDLNDILGDGKVFDIITSETKGSFIPIPMYRYTWEGNEDSVCHIRNRGQTIAI